MKQVFTPPKLHIWTNQLLFIGASHIPYREHQVVSDKLMVSIEGSMVITLDDGQIVQTRSCLVKAGASFNEHYIDTNNATMAIYYLAPLTQDYSALEFSMLKALDGLHYQHPQEAQLIKQLTLIRDQPLRPEQVYTMLRDFIVQPSLQNIIFRQFDHRVIDVLQRIRETVDRNLCVSEFAKTVHLSESRLEKLFKEQIGVPITKYRLRYRVFIGIIQLAMGRTITDAALAAGFASTAHFSKSFSDINGIPPSTTFLKPPFLNVRIAQEVFNAISPSYTATVKSVNNSTVSSIENDNMLACHLRTSNTH
jgi:AraC-like DNA-binding protein